MNETPSTRPHGESLLRWVKLEECAHFSGYHVNTVRKMVRDLGVKCHFRSPRYANKGKRYWLADFAEKMDRESRPA